MKLLVKLLWIGLLSFSVMAEEEMLDLSNVPNLPGMPLPDITSSLKGEETKVEAGFIVKDRVLITGEKIIPSAWVMLYHPLKTRILGECHFDLDPQCKLQVELSPYLIKETYYLAILYGKRPGFDRDSLSLMEAKYFLPEYQDNFSFSLYHYSDAAQKEYEQKLASAKGILENSEATFDQLLDLFSTGNTLLWELDKPDDMYETGDVIRYWKLFQIRVDETGAIHVSSQIPVDILKTIHGKIISIIYAQN